MKYYLITLILLAFLYGCVADQHLAKTADTKLIEKHLANIAKTNGFRNYKNPQLLNSIASYIFNNFLLYCDTVYFQEYTVETTTYKNVIGIINKAKQEKIVVGAHYDVAGDQEGADDNASGVVGLLELARLLNQQELNYQIELVAYSLEEPPFFRTEHMGSYIHAKDLHDNKIDIKGMICLEMIGYFSEESGSQDYPLPHKKLIYGEKGNYILIVQKFADGSFGNDIKRYMKHADFIETKSVKLSSAVPGIDFSDHLNYWKFGYNAIMVTNTSFYRNKNYHQATDKMETLDIDKMSSVINEVFIAIKSME